MHRLNTHIVAVSFGTPYWANVWLEETQAPFPIWLDPDKKSYEVYGMTSSKLAAWGPQNLMFYAKALWRGEKTKGNRGETDQMGGNFIVDKNGIVRFAYPSKNPTDRPEVAKLMQVLREIETRG
ncbi:MAG: peroxiredoxin-like family protein [Chloroflexota bacterium]